MPNHFIRGKYQDEERVIGPSLDAIERAYDVLLALPRSASARWFTAQEHQKAADSNDPTAIWPMLFRDQLNWLMLFWNSSAFKMRQITASLIELYNRESYLPWVILVRSSLEYAAVTYYFVNKMNQLRLKGPRFAAKDLKAFEDLMVAYARGSRFNWDSLLAGNAEELKREFVPSTKAVNVLTAIDSLARRDPRYSDVRIAYEMLSDFVHPNMGSHLAVVQMPAVGETTEHRANLAVDPGRLRGEFMMVASLPWASTGVGTSVELLIEIAPIMKAWLSYLEGGIKVEITFP